MKRMLLVLGLLAQFVICQSAFATSYTFGDTANQWPEWGTTRENLKDTIGSPDITGGSLNVSDTGNLTKVSISATGLLWHTEFTPGDLFINIMRSNNDTTWDYVIKSMGQTAGNVGIYDVRNAGITVASAGPNASYEMSRWPVPADYRDNQPIGVNLIDPKFVGNATYSGLTKTGVSFDFGNLLALEGYNNILLSWTVNCGNDVLYEQVPVPEPGTMALLGAGLLGLVVYSKRRMSKSA